MEVTLLNPLEVDSTLYNIGYFASVCKSDEIPSKENCIKIGKTCISSRHFSTSRNIYWIFRVNEISRVCTHQLVRASIGVNINQKSGVYQASSSNNTDFIVPPSVSKVLDLNPDLKDEYYAVMLRSLDLSEKLRSFGISNSDSRYIIPQAQSSAMNIGFSPEAFFHLCNERMCSHAQWEISNVVKEMAKQICTIEPFYKQFCVPKCLLFNKCTETKTCGFYEAHCIKGDLYE